MSKKDKENKSKGTGCTEPTPARHLNYEGVWEIIKRIVKGETTLSEIGQVVKDLVVNVASHGKRIEVNKRAIRVLDIELLERDHLLWEKMNEVEEAALGGSLDDYLQKKEYLTTEEIDAIIQAVAEKDASLLPDGIENKYLNGTGLAYVLTNIGAVSPYLRVTPTDTQWISDVITAHYEVESNRDWTVE